MVKAQCTTVDPAPGQTASMRGVRKAGSMASTASEHVEIQLYLSKLKQLVPHMPRNRRVSKLEVIQHVIDYICDLQWELEAKTAAAAVAVLATPPPSPTPVDVAARQPLGQLATNATTTQEVR